MGTTLNLSPVHGSNHIFSSPSRTSGPSLRSLSILSPCAYKSSNPNNPSFSLTSTLPSPPNIAHLSYPIYLGRSSPVNPSTGSQYPGYIPPPPPPLLPRLYWCLCGRCRGYKPIEYYIESQDTNITVEKPSQPAVDLDFAGDSDDEDYETWELRNNNLITQLALKNPCKCSQSQPSREQPSHWQNTPSHSMPPISHTMHATHTPHSVPPPHTYSQSPWTPHSASAMARPSHIMNPAQLQQERQQLELMFATPSAKRKTDAELARAGVLGGEMHCEEDLPSLLAMEADAACLSQDSRVDLDSLQLHQPKRMNRPVSGALSSSPCYSPSSTPGPSFQGMATASGMTPCKTCATPEDSFIRYNNNTPDAQRIVQLSCPPHALHSLTTSSIHNPSSITTATPRVYTLNQHGRLTQPGASPLAALNNGRAGNGAQTPVTAALAPAPNSTCGPTIGQTSSIALTSRPVAATSSVPMGGNVGSMGSVGAVRRDVPSHVPTAVYPSMAKYSSSGPAPAGSTVGSGVLCGSGVALASHVPMVHVSAATGHGTSVAHSHSDMEDSDPPYGTNNSVLSSLMAAPSGMSDSVVPNEPHMSREVSMPSHNMGAASLRSTRSINFWGQ